MTKLVDTKRYGSSDELAADSKRSESFINFLPKGESSYRFLTEPDQWETYYEFYHQENKKTYPSFKALSHVIPPGANISRRALAVAIEAENPDEVIKLKLPITVFEDLWGHYERNGTLLDRDYDIIKSGEGINTRYKVYPGDQSKRSVKKYADDIPDLEEVIEDWAQRSLDELVGSDDEAPRQRNAKRAARRIEEETEEEEEEEAPRPKKKKQPVDDEPQFTTSEEQDECREMLQEMLDEDGDAFLSMEIDELREHLAVFQKTSKSSSKSVLARMLKRELQS